MNDLSLYNEPNSLRSYYELMARVEQAERRFWIMYGTLVAVLILAMMFSGISYDSKTIPSSFPHLMAWRWTA